MTDTIYDAVCHDPSKAPALWRQRALLAIAASIVGLLAVEALAWALIGPPHAGHHRIFCTWDEAVGWRLKPSTRARHNTREYDIVENINALGLRGPETTYAKPEGTRRTLLLGDSFFEGYTVADDEVLSAVLADLKPRIDGAKHEVINGGVGGYSTDQELVWLRRYGRRFKPDATVVGFYLNDVWFNAQPRYLRGPKPFFPVRDGKLPDDPVPPEKPRPSKPIEGIHRMTAALAEVSHVYRKLRQHWWKYRFRDDGKDPTKRVAQSPSLHTRPESPEVAAAWRATELLLVALAREVSETGSRFAVLYIPARQHIEGGKNLRKKQHDALRAKLVDICRRNGLRLLDPTKALAEKSRELAGSDYVYLPRDGHWSRQGHAVAAEVIKQWLEESAAAP